MTTLPLLVTATLVLPLAAQQPPAAAERAERRAADDLQAACGVLLEQPIAFTGSCWMGSLEGIGWTDAQAIPFRAAWDRDLSLLRLREFCVLTHGALQVQCTGDGPWTGPQGDAPDLPFSPRALARHIGTATIRSPMPVFVDGRPTMRVHAAWTGEAAAALVQEACHPEAKAQQMLERVPDLVRGRRSHDTVVDAAICFDPASRTLRSLVLRIVLQHNVDLPEGADPDPAPEGLPVLPRRALLQYAFVVNLVPIDQVPMPDLDEPLRQRLRWPPPLPPLAEPGVR